MTEPTSATISVTGDGSSSGTATFTVTDAPLTAGANFASSNNVFTTTSLPATATFTDGKTGDFHGDFAASIKLGRQFGPARAPSNSSAAAPTR